MSFHTVVAVDWECTIDFVGAEGPGDVSDDVEGDAEGRDERNVSHGEEKGRSQASDHMPSTKQRGASVLLCSKEQGWRSSGFNSTSIVRQGRV